LLGTGEGRAVDPRLCVLCRGARNLCGRPYCPVLARSRALLRLRPLESSMREVVAPSPWAVFVGRIGYPRVFVGPGISMHSDVERTDLPEAWPVEDIGTVLDYRMSLVYGRKRVGVTSVDDPLVREIHEVVLSSRPRDVELVFEKPPRPRISLSSVEPPMGPRGVVKRVRVFGGGGAWRVVERLYSDTDASAREAVIELYRGGVPVSHIQKILSVGAVGRKGLRRLVPTRWAITAVDSMISQHLIERIKQLPELGEIRAYVYRVSKNTFIAFLIPGRWGFEWMEAWFPGSTWNPFGREPVVEGDHELLGGRTEYPEIGGCYYASRLAAAEHLLSIGRQATVVILREIYEGFDLPIGVWFVRECVRRMFRERPIRLADARGIAEVLNRFTRLGAERWIRASRILSRILLSRTLDRYLGTLSP